MQACARRAKIYVDGKKLKVGMVCDITYLGNKDAAKTIKCGM